MALISITRKLAIQQEAAQSLSEALHGLGINHAFIGGFAIRMLGGNRATEDIDILVDTPALNIRSSLRQEVANRNPHFGLVGLKYYFAPSMIEGLQGELLIRANGENVLVETLPTRELGLPAQPGPVVACHEVPILHPSILILTKVKRWVNIYESTRPATQKKAETDLEDILYLLDWLKNQGETISFAKYNADHPERLDTAVKKFKEFLEAQGLVEELECLEKVVTKEDWERILS